MAAYTREKEEERQVPEIPAQAEEAQAASSHHPRALKKKYMLLGKKIKTKNLCSSSRQWEVYELDRIIEDILRIDQILKVF